MSPQASAGQAPGPRLPASRPGALGFPPVSLPLWEDGEWQDGPALSPIPRDNSSPQAWLPRCRGIGPGAAAALSPAPPRPPPVQVPEAQASTGRPCRG